MAVNYREIQQLPSFAGGQLAMETAIPGQNPTGAARKLTLGMIYTLFNMAYDIDFNSSMIQNVSYDEASRTITVTLKDGSTYTSNPIPIAGLGNPNPGLISEADWNAIQKLVSSLENLGQRVTVLEGQGNIYLITESQWPSGFDGSESLNALNNLYLSASGKMPPPTTQDIMVHVSSGTSWAYVDSAWHYISSGAWVPNGSDSQLIRGDGTPTGSLDMDLNQGNSKNIRLGLSSSEGFRGLCSHPGTVGLSATDDNGDGASGALGITAYSAGFGFSGQENSGGFGIQGNSAGFGFSSQDVSGSFGITATGAGFGFSGQGVEGGLGISGNNGINICYRDSANSIGASIRMNQNPQPGHTGGSLIEIEAPGSEGGLTIAGGSLNAATEEWDYFSLRLYSKSNLHVINGSKMTLNGGSTVTADSSILSIGCHSAICFCTIAQDIFGGIDADGTPTAKNLYGSSYPTSYGNGTWPHPFEDIPFPFPANADTWEPSNFGSMTADFTSDKLKAVLRIPQYHGCYPRTWHLAASRPDTDSPFSSDSGWV